MDTGTVVAVCAVVIALASLAVSVVETRAVRDHRRRSVRPLLQLGFRTHRGETAGLVLVNSGIGPAVVTQADFTYDGQPMGRFNKVNVDRLRDQLNVRPSASTLGGDVHYVAVGDNRFLLSVDDFDPDAHREFHALLRDRFSLTIRYESLYGGENFVAHYRASEA